MIDTTLINDELMEYFRELSPAERRLRLEAMEDMDEEVISFCKNLYYDRYRDPKKPERSVDNWLWKIVYLCGLYSKKLFFRGALRREAEAAIRDLHLENTDAYSDMEITMLYLEFRNAAKRYLSTCDNPDYGSTLFGLKKSDAESRKARAAEDLWNASRGIAIESRKTDRLEIWCMALRDELSQYDSKCETYYRELESNSR